MPSQLWSKDTKPAGSLWQKPLSPPASAQHRPLASPLSPAEARVKNPGRRYAQVVKLKPEHYERYKEVHAAVWPEVAKQIKNCNIIDCKYKQDMQNLCSHMCHAMQKLQSGCLVSLYLSLLLIPAMGRYPGASGFEDCGVRDAGRVGDTYHDR